MLNLRINLQQQKLIVTETLFGLLWFGSNILKVRVESCEKVMVVVTEAHLHELVL